MIYRCPTKYAVLLLAVRGEDGIFRFPSENAQFPGLLLEPKPLIGIFEQFVDAIQSRLGVALKISITLRHDFSEPLSDVQGDLGTLFVGSLTDSSVLKAAGIQLTPLPHLIRGMGKHRNRVSYLKAWQIMSGADSERTVALETQELAKLLQDPQPH